MRDRTPTAAVPGVRPPITLARRTLSVVVALAGLLAACGDPGAAPGEPSPTDEDPATIAPLCEELTATRDPDAAASPVETPPAGGTDPAEVITWAQREGGEDYAGGWIDPPGSRQVTVAFVGDVDGYRAAVRERFGDGVTVVEAAHAMTELEAVQAEVNALMQEQAADPAGDRYRPAPGTIVSSGIMPQIGRVTVGVVGGDDAALADVSARFGADVICLEVLEPEPPMDPDGPVRPLVKVDGWREGFEHDAYAVLEIAYDAETAERAWRENVPDGLPERDGDPIEEGRYGTFEQVDFDSEALVVWHAGQSGSCPGWLADIATRDGEVTVEHGAAGVGACTDDYNPYRMVLAVDRDRLPAPEDLPLEARDGDFANAVVRSYP